MQNQYLSTFTPSLMSSETLEAIFVQREKLAADLVAGIRESATTKNKHYRLLVGMRGIGKTHTIALIYHRLVNEADLQDKLIIAWLKEEEWGVSSWLDLQISIFQALNNLYPEEYQSKLAAKVEALYELPIDEATLKGETIFKKFVGDRTLLLLTENLDEIFAGLKDKGQKKFRAYLQNHNFITIVATSQSLFNGVTSKKSPFYGFFNPQRLDKLSLAEATDLLTKISQFKQDAELESFVRSQTGQDRIKAIHHLAAGNHRVYIIFSQFLTRESLDELVQPVMQTLDELTPYYQARMQWLSPQQRKIIDLLCDRRGAVPVKEIAQRCFISHQTASSQLKDLLIKGYVGKESKGRESFYELQEPLMRICLEAKKQRGKPIKLFIDFLRIWYTNRELNERLNQLPKKCLEREYIQKALTLKSPFVENINSQTDKLNFLLKKGIESYQKEEYKESLKYFKKVITIDSSLDFVWNIQGNALDSLGQHKKAIDSYDKAISSNPENFFSWTDRGISLFEIGKHDKALESCAKALDINSEEFIIWYNYGAVLYNTGKAELALKSYIKATEINPNDVTTWFNIASIFLQLNKHDNAIDAYKKITEIDSNNESAWFSLGNAQFNLNKYEQAIKSYNKAIEIDSNNESAWLSLGNAQFNLNKYEQAIKSYNKAIEIDSNNELAWLNLGDVLQQLNKYEDAITHFDRVIAIDYNNSSAWFGRYETLKKLGKSEEAAKSLDRSIEIENENAFLYFNQGKAFLDFGWWDLGFKSIETALQHLSNDEIGVDSSIGIIQIISEIKRNYKISWESHLQRLVELYTKHLLTFALGEGIIKNISYMSSEMVSNKAARTWLEVWQEVAGDKSELEIALRWLKTAVEYKESKSDRRVLFQLPKEERDLFITLFDETDKESNELAQ